MLNLTEKSLAIKLGCNTYMNEGCGATNDQASSVKV
jgi:hypothetical protein